MRKITIMEHISLDGVVQSPGGRQEDSENGFTHGGWSMRYSDETIGKAIVAAHDRKFDLLLGRHTYDIWAGYWPNVHEGAIANSFNAATKYVATHRPDSLRWRPAKDLGADIVEGIRALKTTDGPDLLLWGSSTLTPVLMENGLADEIILIVYPVLLGKGKRFFSDNACPQELALADTKIGASGAIMNTYKYVGALA
ncbi:MAG TPA: dihydrofolate reductase family protein, partial [Mucilaginibacter sp.]|nr:dihydrofolate reductase family protein [Mucilaginibacter sp.]